MAFKYHISFATDLAANFGCYRFRISESHLKKVLSILLVSEFIHMRKKSDWSQPDIYKALKPFLSWVCIARAVACFPQASRLLPTVTAANSETPCVYARPSYQPKQCQRAAPRAWPLIWPSKPSITFWNRLRRDCQMTGRGANLESIFGLKLELCRLTNEL